ncbi:MAG TPA: polysaccharide biosynthesis tyrosine autokinase [Gemmatimonadaceae bacterium]
MDRDLARYSDFPDDRQPVAERASDVDEVRVRDVLGVLRRHKVMIAACTILVSTVTVIITQRVTPTYEASVSIRVDEKQPSLPALDALQGIASANEVTTEMAELGSRSVAEEVTDALALRVRVLQPERIRRSEIFASLAAGRGADSGVYHLSRRSDGRYSIEQRASGISRGIVAIGQRARIGSISFVLAPTAAPQQSIELAILPFDAAVGTLESELQIQRPSRDANIIALRYRGTDPELVRDVANAVAAHFIERRQSVRQTETRSTVKFLREQLARLSTQLAQAEDRLRSFREREQIVDLPEEGRSEVGHAAELQAQRNALDAERVALGGLLAQVDTMAEHQRPDAPSPYRNLVAFPTLLRNQAATELLTSLTAAEDRRNDLLVRRTPKDPDVQLQTARIHELEEQLRLITTTYLQGLTNQVASYDAVLRQSERQLGRYPAKEIRLARLQRQSKGLEEIYTLLQTRLKEAEVAEAVEDASVRVVDEASLPRAPIYPRPVLNVSLALLSGLLLGIAAAFVREYADHSVHTRNELQAIARTPVLGLIPRFQRPNQLTSRIFETAQRLTGMASRQGGGPGAAGGRSEGSAGIRPGAHPLARQRGQSEVRMMTEAFQHLATHIAFARPDGAVKRLVLTSPLPGDGKTMVAVNVAVALAQRGRRVLLIDADLRRGMVNVSFHIAREPGLSNVILGATRPRDALRPIRVSETGVLHVLTSGTLQNNPAPAFAAERIRALLAPLEEDYDLIIFDSPPINVVTDAALLSSSCDGVLVVARAGVTAVPALVLAVEQLRQIRAPILGAVLNDIDFDRDATYDGTYRYYGHRVAYDTYVTS